MRPDANRPRNQTTSNADTSAPTLNPISIPLPSHTYKDRQGRPKIIVLHDTEGHNEKGTGDLQTLYDVLLQQGLSVHVGNDAEGNCARYVSDDKAAQHVASYNGTALGIEQIGFMTQSSWPEAQLKNTAAWVAYWSKKYNIPIKFSTKHGICRHSDLGEAGGNHGDPGPNYPFNKVLRMAASYSGVTVNDSDLATSSGDTSGAGGAADSAENSLDPSLAKAAAFTALLQLPGELNSFESLALRGQRSLQNDQPLFPFVQQICQASLRSFQSMPNGDFFAFFPDYFGSFNWRTPYWEIHDVEIIDGNLELSDDALATHVFVWGDTVGVNMQIDTSDKLNSAVITVLDAFMAGFLNENPTSDGTEKPKQAVQVESSWPSLKDKQEALAFLQQYGARPYAHEAPMVRSVYYETFLAYQTFMLMWAKQFLTTFKFTYMPELFPGGIVAFPEHGVQCFVEEVVHQCNYEEGFTTTARLSAPAAIRTGNSQEYSDPSRAYVHAGLIQANRAEK